MSQFHFEAVRREQLVPRCGLVRLIYDKLHAIPAVTARFIKRLPLPLPADATRLARVGRPALADERRWRASAPRQRRTLPGALAPARGVPPVLHTPFRP